MEPLRRVLPALLALVLVAGCGSSSGAGTGGASTATSLATKKPGALTVGIEPYGPPFQIGSATNPSGGYEIDMVREIARRLGIDTIHWTRVPFGKVVTSAASASWDFDVDEFSITPERAKVVDFSAPYFHATEGVLAKKGSDAANAKSVADLRPLHLGGQSGTTGIYTIQQVIKADEKPAEFPSTGAANLAVKAGTIDAEVNDLPILLDAVTKDPDLVVSGQIETGDAYGLVFAKGNPLRKAVNEQITAMQQDGTLDRLAQKYKLTSSTVPILH
jgi:polar amino acid transport system substrate-binding protein